MQKEIILAVDDLPENLMMIKMGLRKYNYEVVTANSGFDALENSEKHHTRLDFDGYSDAGHRRFETTARIKEIPHLKDVPLLFISALKDLSNIIRCFEAGAVDM
jgi:CheY-like chemotaxis protein